MPYIFDKLNLNKQQILLKATNSSDIDSLVTKLKQMINNCNLSTELNVLGLNKNDVDIIISQTPKERLEPVPYEFSEKIMKQILLNMFEK